jgi:lipid II:glycine glycyltransferase (peptidoglycan interpeptide bridge formation enzyme)
MTAQATTNLSQKSTTDELSNISQPAAAAIETELVDPLREPEWDTLVMSHPDCTFFHSAAWARVLHKTYRHKPVYLRFSQSAKAVALVPMMDLRSPLTGRRGVCLPFTDFCGPLIFGDVDSAMVMNKLCDLARERKWKYFEIRNGNALVPSGTSGEAFYGHTLDLGSNTEDLFKRFKGSARTSVRKAQRSGLSVQVTWEREAILQFFRLHTQTRRRHGLPPQPLSFFTNIYNQVIKAGLGFVVMVKKGPLPIAAGVFFFLGKKAVYKFSASDERVRELQGNNLMLWEGIRFLAENGIESLHFGRSSLENDGLRRFKLSWGTREEIITYLKFDAAARPLVARQDAVQGFHNTVFRKLPLSINRLAGSIIYPHLD